MTLNPIKYKRGNLEILNQLEIPEKLEFIPIPDVKEAWEGVMTLSLLNTNYILHILCDTQNLHINNII